MKKKTPPCGDVFERSSETRKPGSVLNSHLSKTDVLINLPTYSVGALVFVP
jgi:hypothetical protein